MTPPRNDEMTSDLRLTRKPRPPAEQAAYEDGVKAGIQAASEAIQAQYAARLDAIAAALGDLPRARAYMRGGMQQEPDGKWIERSAALAIVQRAVARTGEPT